MSNKGKMICVCRTNGTPCADEGFKAIVKKTEYIFCCQKGFETSLKDFSKLITKKR